MSQYRPTTPVEAEQKIVEANAMLDALIEALKEVNVLRYAAEAAWSEKKNTRMVFWQDQGRNVTYSRAKAEVEAKPEWEEWHELKVQYHHLEGLQKALQTRINSWLNINKGVQSAYNSYRGQ